MKYLKLDYPKNSADAIAAVCYLNRWSVVRLAREMGLVNGSYLGQVYHFKEPGSPELTERILAHMPEKFRKHMEAKP